MDFSKFIKNLFGQKSARTKTNRKEKVSFESIHEWIEKRKNTMHIKEKVVLKTIEEKITLLVKELNEKVTKLEKVDLNSINSEKRINAIVKSSINNYVGQIKSLSNNLNGLKNENLDELVKKTKQYFLDFNKKTFVNYQKASFLIDEELRDLHKSVVWFSDFFTKILQENKELIDFYAVMDDIEKKTAKIKETEKNIDDITKNIRSIKKKMEITKESIQKDSKRIEEIKKSEEYQNNLKLLEDVQKTENELLDEIYKIKQNIDFKALGNIYHSSDKKMEILKSHRDNFANSFQKDDGEQIISLLGEAKFPTEVIIEKKHKIANIKHKLAKEKSMIRKDETKDLSDAIAKSNLDLNTLNDELEKEAKRLNKLETNKEEQIVSLKEDLQKVNVILSD